MKEKSAKKPTPWLGGYVRHGKKGPAYVIERWIDGKRFHISTKCRTREAALEQLRIFESDPANYRPHRRKSLHAPPKAGIFLNAETLDDYLDWMTERPKPATRGHMLQHRGRLKEWIKFYNGRDIREVELSEVAAFLKGKANLYMRVQSLKSFCAWLRQEKFALKRSEDPTLDLRTPAARATKQDRSVVITEREIAAVFPFLPAVTQDVLILRFGTGWHVEECRRFAKEGLIEKPEGRFVLLPGPHGTERVPLLATLRVWQAKAETWTATPILYPEHLDAAERIKARGYVPHRVTLQRHMVDASTKAGLPRALWQWHIRHSVVSHAIESGVRDEDAGNFVDHMGGSGVTRRHYKQVAHPTKAVPVLRILGGGLKGG